MNGFRHLDRLPSTGYVSDTMRAVLWAVAEGRDYPSTVLNAVNLGGDTDTIGALAGGVAGILYGKESIPDEWISALRGRNIIDVLLDRAGAASRRESEETEPSENKPDATPRMPLMQRLPGTLFGKEH